MIQNRKFTLNTLFDIRRYFDVSVFEISRLTVFSLFGSIH